MVSYDRKVMALEDALQHGFIVALNSLARSTAAEYHLSGTRTSVFLLEGWEVSLPHQLSQYPGKPMFCFCGTNHCDTVGSTGLFGFSYYFVSGGAESMMPWGRSIIMEALLTGSSQKAAHCEINQNEFLPIVRTVGSKNSKCEWLGQSPSGGTHKCVSDLKGSDTFCHLERHFQCYIECIATLYLVVEGKIQLLLATDFTNLYC